MIIVPRFFGSGFTPSEVSVDFDGTTEYMESSTNISLGFADQWSIMTWMNYLGVQAGFNTYFQMRGTLAPNNINNLINCMVATGVIGQARCTFRDNTGVTYKDFRYDDTIPLGSWVQVVFTYDGDVAGDELLAYFDSIKTVATLKNVDLTGTQDDTDPRFVSSGAALGGALLWDGKLHQTAVWNSVLTQAEVTALYGGGSGDFDLNTNSGDYVSAANLQHWYQYGKNADNIGEDTALGGIPHDTDSLNNITGADIVTDAPS